VFIDDKAVQDLLVESLLQAVERYGDNLEHQESKRQAVDFPSGVNCLSPKGKNVKSQKLLCPEESKTQVVAAVARDDVVAIR
jgi:hypothetical protein